MAITLSITAVTTTSMTFGFGSMGASGTIELQISTRRDFSFCVCPIYTGIPRSSPYTFEGLNQGTTYFARARTRLSDGSAEPWSNITKYTTNPASDPTYPAGVLIEPALIVVPEVYEAIAGGNELGGAYPFSNVSIDAPVAWRTPGYLSAGRYYYVLFIDTGGAPIDTVAMLNTNLDESALMTIGCSADAAGTVGFEQLALGVPFRASPSLPGRPGYHGLFRFPVKYQRIFRFDISSKLPILHLEHLVVGKARTHKNIAIDKTENSSSLTTLERRRSGLPDRQRGLPMRKVDFDIAAMSETKYETLFGDLIRQQNEPVLVVPNSRSGAFLHDRILYGDLTGGRVVMNNSNVFTRSFTVDSLI